MAINEPCLISTLILKTFIYSKKINIWGIPREKVHLENKLLGILKK